MFAGRPELERLFGEDRLFVLDRGGIEIVGRQRERRGRRDVHGDLAAKLGERRLVGFAFDGDEHADAAQAGRGLVVHIARHGAGLTLKWPARRSCMFSPTVAIRLVIMSPTVSPSSVTAALMAAMSRPRRARPWPSSARAPWKRALRATKSVSALSSVTAPVMPLPSGRIAIATSPSAATRPAFFAAFDNFGPQPVDGRLHGAVGLGERALAVHHARAGPFAQFLHEAGRDLSHGGLHRFNDARRTRSVRRLRPDGFGERRF